MRLRDTGRWLLRRWAVVGGALLLAAFGAGLYLGFSDSGDIVAQPEPTPDVVFNTPTIEEWTRMWEDPTGPPVIHVIPTPEPRAARQTRRVSKAEAEYLAAPKDKVIYFEELDKVIHLPDGVYTSGVSVGYDCSLEACPAAPSYNLYTKGQKSCAMLGFTGDGYMINCGDPEDFEFLAEAGFKRFE